MSKFNMSAAEHQLRGFAERMAGLLADICEGGMPEDMSAMLKEADELVDEWREFSTIFEVQP